MSTASVTTSETASETRPQLGSTPFQGEHGSTPSRDEGEIVSETGSPTRNTETTRQRRPERRVDTDPRTTGFIIGRNHANLKTLGADLKAQYGESVFIKYIQPPGKQWGFWKVLSRSEEALETASKWIRDKEQECHRAIANGTYEPRAPRLDSSYDRPGNHPRDGDGDGDYDRPRNNHNRPPYNHDRPPYNHNRPPYNQHQSNYNHDCPPYNQHQSNSRDYDRRRPNDRRGPRSNYHGGD